MDQLADAQWFPYDGRMHAIDPAKTARNHKPTGYCGLAPMSVPDDSIEHLVVSDIPHGEPCRTCLVQVAMQSVNEEPLDHAQGRGYISTRNAGNLDEL